MSVYIDIKRASRSKRVDYPKEGRKNEKRECRFGSMGQRNMVTGK
jgi:hypothetical protein